MKYSLPEIIESLNESVLSKEDKMYCETIANLAYLCGVRDTGQKRLEELKNSWKPTDVVDNRTAEEVSVENEMLNEICPPAEEI